VRESAKSIVGHSNAEAAAREPTAPSRLRHIDLKEDDASAIAVGRLRQRRHDQTRGNENRYSRECKQDCSHESAYRRSCCARHSLRLISFGLRHWGDCKRWDFALVAARSAIDCVIGKAAQRRRRRAGTARVSCRPQCSTARYQRTCQDAAAASWLPGARAVA
jgi:hypothetical protein